MNSRCAQPVDGFCVCHFSLVSIHPNAVPAAELAMCAGRAGKFWEAHDLVFRTQKVWALHAF